ncbi:hypothetical protein ACFB49_45630 [Sphingomonas sp. DBB INV C78]|uniref:flagellar biosynthetic protein FliO n=1 Tax=Sphingomonas sp. DBB INV C78 TaxID=3349434 RepID=UPI0036D40B5A
MDFLSLLRTLGSLGIVLGLLWGALWAVRRYDLKLPGSLMGSLGGLMGQNAAPRRVEVIERLAIDTRRSVALIRRDNKEHLVMITPEGLLMIEAGIPVNMKAKANA